MWQELQELRARVETLEQRLLKANPAPEMTEVLAKLDKFEKILGRYTAPKR